VIAVGHTDTTGSRASNFALGLKRAITVRNLLAQAGLDTPSIEATTLGETDLLILTADEVAEPRNRRVEIVVR
jgi:outer membrane protein OmpA-like peptidoglycan-associated protein